MSTRLRSGLLGLLISVAAVLAAWGYLYLQTTAASPSGKGSRLALVVSAAFPLVTLYGLVAVARGFIFDAPLLSKKTLILTAFVMLFLGACPWLYTDYLVGGRPGNEGSGMLGTIIFILVGVPGFILTIVGLVAGWLAEE